MRRIATAWRVGWVVVAAAGAAYAQERPARPPAPIAASEALRFGSVEEVPTGTYVATNRAGRRFVLTREGGRLRLDELFAEGAVRRSYAVALEAGRPDGLALDGHHGLAFRRERDGSVRMEVLFCYEHVTAVLRPGG